MTAKQTDKRNRHATRGRRSSNARSQEYGSARTLPRAAKSFLITLAVGAALLLIAAIWIYFMPDPSPVIRPVGIAVAALTALIGGVVTGKLHGSAPALCGLLNGALLSALMLLLSFFFRPLAAGYAAWISALLHAMIPLCSIAGAMMGVRKKPAPRRKRR